VEPVVGAPRGARWAEPVRYRLYLVSNTCDAVLSHAERINGLLAIPLLSVFSLPITYNIIVLFSFVMGGYGAFLLVHYCCRNRWAALVGSVVFAYSAYHIATMRGLLQLISLEWVPFFVPSC
jgi:hypothetical protein